MNNNIEKIFQDTAFQPHEIKILCDAYAKACKSLHDKGQPPIVNEIIAQRIIALASGGERDPDKLSEGALSALVNRTH
jgi:hypothetical protein